MSFFPLEDALNDVKAAGWMLNNLFQRHDRSWQCNLRSTGANSGTPFGVGDGPTAAVRAALAAAAPVAPPVAANDSVFD